MSDAVEAPEAGAPAPAFTLPNVEGDAVDEVSLADLKGRIVVLYFYPRDDTSGCTTEALEFSEKLDEFKDAGAVVFGVSKDSVSKHKKFIAKKELAVPLLSDEESDVTERYGVWVEKSMYGKKYMGIERATFLIDREGVVAQVWRKVKPKGHAAAVLEAVRGL